MTARVRCETRDSRNLRWDGYGSRSPTAECAPPAKEGHGTRVVACFKPSAGARLGPPPGTARVALSA